MRIACCLALAALLVPAARADAQDERALIAFVPAANDAELLDRMERSGIGAVGVTSPTVGGYDPLQVFLDIGQGARVSTRVYEDELGALRLLPDGRLAGWEAVVERAEDAPGDVVPGLLGESVHRAGGRTAYVGLRGLRHGEAASVADRSGRVDAVELGEARGFGARLEAALAEHDLVAARLPAGGGLALLEQLETEALVIAVRAPGPGGLEQLPTAVSVGEGVITSRTTRRAGMVAATDYAPTILDRLGMNEADDMDGHVIEAEDGEAADVQSLVDRLDHLRSRRDAALLLSFGLWLAVLAVLALTGRRRTGLRLGLLVAMWLPGLALLTGALDPSEGVEALILAAGSLGLAAGTDRAVAWPRAPAVAAAVVLAVHAADLVAGSPLIARSLAGPNPGFGARFFGIGNELEAILAALVLLGAGAALAGRDGRRVPIGFAAACTVAALFIGAGRLGADVGGVITLGAGAAAAVLASLPGGVTRRAVAIAVVTPVLAVAALAAVDLVSGGDAHLTRSVLSADSPRELVDVAERRIDISWESLWQGTTPLSVGLFAVALGWGVARRRRLLAPLEGDRAFAAGMWGTLAATVVGALANDSGPTIFLIGAFALVLASAYVTGKPLGGGLT
ncbi:MAG TPA: hypothetical protein VD790_11085 [Thermoleophilaceae bacterium]|nr:hypothetical protein [Thermoleophilaceae bacterium]